MLTLCIQIVEMKPSEPQLKKQLEMLYIAEPTGITLKDGKWYVESGAIITVFEDEINMDFVNELEKESDFKAYWGD